MNGKAKIIRDNIVVNRDFFHSILKPGQEIRAYVGGENFLKCEVKGSSAFIAEVISELLVYTDGDVAEMVILRYADRLDKDESIPSRDKIKRMLYTYDLARLTLFNEELKELENLREKVRKQEITINNLTSALSILEGGKK